MPIDTCRPLYDSHWVALNGIHDLAPAASDGIRGVVRVRCLVILVKYVRGEDGSIVVVSRTSIRANRPPGNELVLLLVEVRDPLLFAVEARLGAVPAFRLHLFQSVAQLNQSAVAGRGAGGCRAVLVHVSWRPIFACILLSHRSSNFKPIQQRVSFSCHQVLASVVIVSWKIFYLLFAASIFTIPNQVPVRCAILCVTRRTVN